MAAGNITAGDTAASNTAAGNTAASRSAAGNAAASRAPAGGAPALARFSAQARLRALQSDILELILERDLVPGDPLPTESELTAALGVGRNTLRESLKALQAVGVIEIRHGFGMFVAPNNFDALTDGLTFRARLSLRHHGEEAMQLVEVRQALESGLVGAAMQRITAEQLAGMEESVHRMETLAAAGEPFIEADAEFHRRLFEPLNNELLISLMDVFWQVYRQIHLELGPFAVDLHETAALHRRIYEAVASADKELAAEALSSHFDGIRSVIVQATA